MKCTNCGREVNEGENFCRGCGVEVAQLTEVIEKKFCASCGKLIAANAQFCNNCGHQVSKNNYVAENTNCCPNCNSPLRTGASFCGQCGFSLSQQPFRKVVPAEMPEMKKDSGLMVVLIVLLMVILMGSFGIIGYLYYQNNSNETKTVVTNTEETKEEKNIVVEDDTSSSNKYKYSSAPYLFPSDRRYITYSDLIGKTKEEVALIRNEIYARHGYIFNKEPYKSYFESQSWYVPNPYFDDFMFNGIEKANKEFLIQYEEDRGWR